jgi:hypothetical protein
MMIGRKKSVTINMMKRVSRLLEASHTVRLAFGTVDDGSRNGKRAIPPVSTTPAQPTLLDMKARPIRRLRNASHVSAVPA